MPDSDFEKQVTAMLDDILGIMLDNADIALRDSVN